ncbi:MAG: division/cell wall cluster transcriptional repressor MraZ [Clostridiales bacterium]|nr:division/cell wall cluster transcriptional repressor MraZ [Clostridiales bacterium]
MGGRAARFYGNFKNSLDAKGRVFIPAKFREGLGTYFTLTKGFDACLVIYTMQDWETISELLESIPSTDREGREFKRHFFGNAIDCEMDKQGRIGISQDLREYARLTGDIGFIGMGKRIELWNWENWKANNSTYGDNAEVLSKAAQKYLAGKAAVL